MYYEDYVIETGLRMHPKYDRWRKAVLKRDDFKCVDCGTRPFVGLRTIYAHHINKFIDILRENNIDSIDKALECKALWDISNGKTLCRECHDKYRNKQAWYK